MKLDGLVISTSICLISNTRSTVVWENLLINCQVVPTEQVAEPRRCLGLPSSMGLQVIHETEVVGRESKSFWIGNRSSIYVGETEGWKPSKDDTDLRRSWKSKKKS